MKRFTKMLDSCTVILRKPTALTYEILQECVAGYSCVRYLKEFESEIINLL